MENLYDINTIKSILNKHGFAFSKSLGQNFIIDPSVCPQMAESAIPANNYGVIEIGPGIGVLTVELAKRAKKVVSIELDKRLLSILDETLAAYSNIKIINEDVMKVDLNKIISEEFKDIPVVICANLPYYITSPVIMMLLEQKLPIETITVMVQSEAADRLCADVGTRNSGAVTIAVNMYANADELFFVPRDSFIPSPKVDSKVMQLSVHKESPYQIKNEKDFLKMVKSGFGMRRKTILNSLPGSLGVTKEALMPILTELEIPSNYRIEQLSMDQLISIWNSFN